MVVAIGSGGNAPLPASVLRQRLDRVLPERLATLAALAGRFRPLVRRRLTDPAARSRFWRAVFTGEPASLALAGDEAAARDALLDSPR